MGLNSSYSDPQLMLSSIHLRQSCSRSNRMKLRKATLQFASQPLFFALSSQPRIQSCRIRQERQSLGGNNGHGRDSGQRTMRRRGLWLRW